MALTVNTTREKKICLAEQSTWGTAIADSAAMVLFGGNPAHIDRDVKVRNVPVSSGSRNPSKNEIITHQSMAAPKITLSGPAKFKELDMFLYALVQNVTEGATTPFDKTFTFGDTQPDFTSDAGYFLTVGEYSPAHNDAGAKIADCIASRLKIMCEPGGLLEFECDLQGRGAPTASFNPTGTLTQTAASFWEWAASTYGIARLTFNDGTEYTLKPAGTIEVEFTQDLQPVSIDATDGTFETFAILNPAGVFRAKVLAESGSADHLWDNFGANDLLTFNWAWGGATAGDTSGDLDFDFTGKIISMSDPNEDLHTLDIEVQMCADTGTSNNHCTITMANEEDRSW
jgi:hypothetical protein